MALFATFCDSPIMPPMAVPDFSPLTAGEVDALLGTHLKRLADEPCHGNRLLTHDRLFQGMLLAQFDPMVRSLRLIEGCGDFNGRLDLGRMARSTTSDALAACDPALLAPVIEDLTRRIPDLPHADASLGTITRRIIAADGTYLATLADVAWAIKHGTRDGKVHGQFRANVQMDVRNWVPQVITISGDDNKSEPAAFVPDLLPDVVYVADRNFVEFDFYNAVLKVKSDFVIRARSNAPGVEVKRVRPLGNQDVAAGVTADADVTLTGKDAPAGTFRQTTFTYLNRTGETETCRVISTLTGDEVAARTVAEIYRLRWQIELFFRWLKVYAGMDGLISTSRNGITYQLHIMVISVLLMYVRSGTRVSIYALAVFSRVANGTMTLEAALEEIAKRERERLMNRARQARKRAEKKKAA
jgi:hypothetical protein